MNDYTRKDRDRLRPFVHMAIHGNELLEAMSDEELDELLESIKNLSTSNCWWVTWETSKVLKRQIERVQRERRANENHQHHN